MTDLRWFEIPTRHTVRAPTVAPTSRYDCNAAALRAYLRAYLRSASAYERTYESPVSPDLPTHRRLHPRCVYALAGSRTFGYV